MIWVICKLKKNGQLWLHLDYILKWLMCSAILLFLSRIKCKLETTVFTFDWRWSDGLVLLHTAKEVQNSSFIACILWMPTTLIERFEFSLYGSILPYSQSHSHLVHPTSTQRSQSPTTTKSLWWRSPWQHLALLPCYGPRAYRGSLLHVGGSASIWSVSINTAGQGGLQVKDGIGRGTHHPKQKTGWPPPATAVWWCGQ